MSKRPVFDAVMKLAIDKGSVRSFDSDGRLRVKVTNISKANICPYKGEEIPGWEELGLDRGAVYQMFRDPEELKKAAPTFNGVQLLRVHKPVDANDHQMWDIVGCTGTEAEFSDPYLTNSLSVWTKEGIALIESKAQCELSCGYHYVPDMTPGTFDGKHYDGIMRSIEGNHVALVEEGRAGPDVVVGDSALERDHEMKPTRLEYAVLLRSSAAVNPLLAMDAKVDYRPIFKGLTTGNFKGRKAAIIAGLKSAIAGKTIAKDASIEHLAHMLDAFEGAPSLGDKEWDEGVSEPEAKAMEAASSGESSLGIPNVAEEFAPAPAEPKKFGDAMRAWAKDNGKEFSDEEYSAMDAMHTECMGAKDEDPDAALDADDPDKDKDDGAKDGDNPFVKKDDDDKDGKKDEPKAKDSKGAKDQAKDSKDGGAMKSITQDEVNSAIAAATASERKRNQEANEARAFVRPYVGDVSIALDSAETILRGAAEAMQIDGAKDVHVSALKPLIKIAGDSRRQAAAAHDGNFFTGAMDSNGGGNVASFDKMFPNASRIGNAA